MNKSRRHFKALLFTALLLVLVINLILISQAYHLTHFYEHGTVKTMSEQTSGFWGKAQVVLFGLKQEKIVGAIPDSAFSNIKLKTKDGLVLDAWLIHVPSSKGIIAIFHGNGSEKSANLSQSNTFNEMGYSTLLVDFRAHGQSEGIPAQLVTVKRRM